MVIGIPTGGGGRSRGGLFSYIGFPLLVIPVVIYNIIAFGRSLIGGDPTIEVDGVQQIVTVSQWFGGELFRVSMPTGGLWIISPGDLLMVVSLFFLFLEILKSTSTGSSAIMNHALSMVLFIVCMVQFLLLPQFATSVFFLITLMTLLDVLAGFTVSIVTARRDIAVGQDFS